MKKSWVVRPRFTTPARAASSKKRLESRRKDFRRNPSKAVMARSWGRKRRR
jgi:hypothetical protein